MFSRESWSYYKDKDYGTKITSSNYVKIKVKVNPSLIMKDFAQAYCTELHRRNPLKMDASSIDEDTLYNYFVNLLKMRILYVSPRGLRDWRRAKQLYIPSYVEFILTQIGEVVDTVHGCILTPTMDDLDYKFDDLLEVSNNLRSFLSDGVSLFVDAMPRSREGDIQTMSCVIIDNFVCAPDKFLHPYGSYAAAFLGLQLEDESFAPRFNVRYDDVQFIRHALCMDYELIIGGHSDKK